MCNELKTATFLVFLLDSVGCDVSFVEMVKVRPFEEALAKTGQSNSYFGRDSVSIRQNNFFCVFESQQGYELRKLQSTEVECSMDIEQRFEAPTIGDQLSSLGVQPKFVVENICEGEIYANKGFVCSKRHFVVYGLQSGELSA